MGEKIIISLPLVMVMALVIIVGYSIVNWVVKRKWGYTEERERKLDEMK